MVEKRIENRVAFVSLGVVDSTREKIPCILENISNGGALINMNSHVPGSIKEGDILHLKAVFLSPVECHCRVARIDHSRIAIQFIDK